MGFFWFGRSTIFETTKEMNVTGPAVPSLAQLAPHLRYIRSTSIYDAPYRSLGPVDSELE